MREGLPYTHVGVTVSVVVVSVPSGYTLCLVVYTEESFLPELSDPAACCGSDWRVGASTPRSRWGSKPVSRGRWRASFYSPGDLVCAESVGPFLISTRGGLTPRFLLVHSGPFLERKWGLGRGRAGVWGVRSGPIRAKQSVP